MDLVRPLRHSEPRSHPTGQPLSSGLHGPSPHGAGGLADNRLSRLTNRLRFRSSGWKLFVVFVLVLGVAVSAASASAWYAYVSSQRRQAAASSLGSVKSILASSLERDSDLLATVNALVATHPQLTNGSLAAILSRLDLSQHYPGSIAFAYVESVSRAGLPEFEAVTRRDPPLGVASSARIVRSYNGASGYCLTRLAAFEVLPGQQFLKNLLVSWATPYLSAHLNYCASTFENMLDSSAATGRSSVVPATALLGRLPRGMPALPQALLAFVARFPVFIEFSPVYAEPQVPATTQGRAKALTGWAMGIFAADEILDPALANEKGVSVALAYASPGAKPTVLARAGQPQPEVVGKTFTFSADPGWVLDVAVDPRGNGPSPATQGLAVLLGALLLTILLTSLLHLLIASRRSALELVEERTAELRHQALHDSLTGLPNRLSVDQRVYQFLGRAGSEGRSVAAFFIDLDDFKRVNDTLGHGTGDELLRAVAARLSATVRDSDTVGRLGGDEFVVLSEGPFSEEGLNLVAERLLTVLREPFRLGHTTMSHLSISASIGIASGLRDYPEELLRDADTAMYRAKAMGKNCHVIFAQEMHEVVKRQMALERDLADAFANREFFIVYQPIISLETGLPRDVEALLRWRHPSRGVVGPVEFIPVLETSDLMIDVGRFVLMEACRQVKAWHDLGYRVGISVNVAARQLRHDVLIDHVREALEAASLDASYLTLEVTESMLMIDSETTAQRLTALSDLGVRIAIDDFGTGYSSISYLREFPADILKIDQSFVAHLDTSAGTSFLDALIQLGKSLGLLTIAEGIEQMSQLKHLQQEGCDWGQGYLFSKPLLPEKLEQIFNGCLPTEGMIPKADPCLSS